MFGREGNSIRNEKRGFQAGGKEARWVAWAWCGRGWWIQAVGWAVGPAGILLHLLLHGAENTVVVFVHTISRRGMVMIKLVFVD